MASLYHRARLNLGGIAPYAPRLGTPNAFSGYRCRAVAGGGQALELLNSGEMFDLVTSDLMNTPLDGVSFLEKIKSQFPEMPILMITAVHDISVSLACIRNGAYDYLLKPFEREQLIFALRRALEYRNLKLENRKLQAQIKKWRNRNRLAGSGVMP